ncbi:MAG: hypothetical protein ACRDN9_07355 [Streptosporangiaceae bacterium]
MRSHPSARVRVLWAAALVLAALTMGLTFAHTLELPRKMTYGPALWTRVEHTLYAYFAMVGAPIEVITVVLLIVLAVPLRRHQAFWFVVVAAACFAAALGSWFALVQPANAAIGAWSVHAVPADWTHWRARWEYGHVTGFALMLVGYLSLTVGTVGGMSGATRHPRDPGAPPLVSSRMPSG